MNTPRFLPVNKKEMAERNWDQLDVILITGDAYIDSPYIGTAVIGRVLEAAGFRVGVIAQPDMENPADIARLGEPRLFWGVSAGSVDSMVANYTALKKRRKQDDYTPGGINNRRPDRATIAYTNLIRRNFKNTVPVVLGGIEASLRRIAHYDFWDNRVRRSVLFDAKADYLLFGMGEESTVLLAQALADGWSPEDIPGLCRMGKTVPEGYLELPEFASVQKDKGAFLSMFKTFYDNNDPYTAKGLAQRHGDRYLIQNPPAPHLSTEALDEAYALPFVRDVHPEDAKRGSVRALETIRFSLFTHQGCYGECNFCAIAVHQGRTVRWRSEAAILREAEVLTTLPGFKGILQDVGGPTANMYGYECKKKLAKGPCADRRCLYPAACPALKPDHSANRRLLRKLRSLPGIRKVFVASGIRYDVIDADPKNGSRYLDDIVCHHVSGQMKVAPEHTEERVLSRMGKPGPAALTRFKATFENLTKKAKKPQFLTYYFIAAHPGCTENDMKRLSGYAAETLRLTPEQVQIFTPTPSTWSTAMYWTEMDPFTGQQIFVEKNPDRKRMQKTLLTSKKQERKKQNPARTAPSDRRGPRKGPKPPDRKPRRPRRKK